MRRIGRCSLALLALCSPLAGAQEPASLLEVHIPGAEAPAVLDRVASFEGLTALAVSADLERVAVAYLSSEKPEKSSLLIYQVDVAKPTSIEVAGRIRDLLFASDQSVVYGLQHKSAKKREGDSYLVVYEPERRKLRRALRLPASARALDHWTVRNSLLVASRNEIRTLQLPDLRSGPLFRVPGNNLAVTTIAGGNLVLVGQDEGLVLVNLTDPPGQFEMPIRGSTRSPGPVVSVASSPDGSEALARLDDGRLFAISFDPLRLAERGNALALASLEGRDELPEKAEPDAVEAAAPVPEQPRTEPRAAVETTPPPTPGVVPAEVDDAAASTVGAAAAGATPKPDEPQPEQLAEMPPPPPPTAKAEGQQAQPADPDRPAAEPPAKTAVPPPQASVTADEMQRQKAGPEQTPSDSPGTTGQALAPESITPEAAPAPGRPGVAAAAATVSTRPPAETGETAEVEAAEDSSSSPSAAPTVGEARVPSAVPDGSSAETGTDPGEPPTRTAEPPPLTESSVTTPANAPQLRGRILGPAAPEVVSVVVLGPDNILREAARVTPSADGHWQADRLEPGRYRIQLDGGGGRVLVSDPPFLLLEITPDGSTTVPDIRVIRAL
jgi:hypothetical protein